MNGLKVQQTKLADMRFLFYGAGSSAVGVVDMLSLLLQKQGGLSAKEAMSVSLLFCLTTLCNIPGPNFSGEA